MSENHYDLHCHSTCSDGTFSPEELLAHAKEIGLKGISITDHDTIIAYEVAIEEAKRLGLGIISGVEFSAVHKGVSVHTLGYAFDLESESIRKLCERHRTRRANRYRSILELLAKHGMPLEEQELPKGSIGRPHIALAMMEKGYVKNVKEAFRRYLGEGKPCFLRTEVISVEETLDAIHQGGGLAVIAHPHLIKNKKIFDEVLDMGYDGIEGYYARFSLREESPWIELAENRGLIVTGGSDFHGKIKPNNPLGASWVREETFQMLEKHFHNASLS